MERSGASARVTRGEGSKARGEEEEQGGERVRMETEREEFLNTPERQNRQAGRHREKRKAAGAERSAS